MFLLKFTFTLPLLMIFCLLSMSTVTSGNSSGGTNTQSVCQCSNGRNGLNGRNGNNGPKGEKGDRGPPGPPGETPSTGNVIFVNSSELCVPSKAGKVKYDPRKKGLDLCNGQTWLPIPIGPGNTRSIAAKSCLEIKNKGNHHGNDFYWIDPNGGLTDDAFEAFCDMETEGGGWTLVATKVTPSFVFIKSQFSAHAARSTLDDAASSIHPSMRAWTEVLFRFANRNDIYLVYNRDGGGHSAAKTGFDNFMMGHTISTLPDTAGFYKSTPLKKRFPESGFAVIIKFHYYSSNGLSEIFTGTDKWLDLWNVADGSNNYFSSDSPEARGTKCIAGYCFRNIPVWVMIR